MYLFGGLFKGKPKGDLQFFGNRYFDTYPYLPFA